MRCIMANHIQWVRLVVAMIAGLTYGQVMGAQATTTFQVTSNVASSCTITVPALSFGAYDTNSASPTDSTTTISVFCTTGTAFTTALDVGTTTGGDYLSRLMLGATNADTLGYNLYTDAAHTTVWGDGTGVTATVPGTGTGPLVAVSQTVYGRITAQQNVSVDTYSDTITATVTY